MRYFGIGYWTFLDGGMVAIGGLVTAVSLKHFLSTAKHRRIFDRKLKDQMHLELEPSLVEKI